MRMLWRGRGRHRVETFAREVESGVPSSPDDASTSRLVGLANALRSMPLRPSPEFTLAFRRRIVNAARAGRAEEPRSLLPGLFEGFRIQRGLASVTALLTAAVALVSIGFGTTQALPGDTLYGLKLRGESISIALARSDEAKGHSYLQFAGARLRDVSGLIDHDGAWRDDTEQAAADTAERPSHHLAGLVNSTLKTMNGYTDAGARSLRRAYQRTGDMAPLAYLDDFTQQQRTTLSGMLGKLPQASQSVAGDSLNLVNRIGREANKLLTQQCNHVMACQSESRPPDRASSAAPSVTPTQAPASSLTKDIPTTASPDPGQEQSSQDTTTQRVPSTSEQPPSTTTPTDTGTSAGDQSGGTPTSSPTTSSTDPSSTGGSTGGSTSGDSSGGSGDDTSTSTDSAGSESVQPSPPQPTGVPSTSSERSTDASGPDAADGSGGGDSTPAPATSAGSGGQDAASAADGSAGSTGSAGSEGSGGPGGPGGPGASAGTNTLARPDEPRERSRTASSEPSQTASSDPSDRSAPADPSNRSTPPGTPPADPSTTQRPSGDSSASGTPTP